jgi:hypothetical protein
LGSIEGWLSLYPKSKAIHPGTAPAQFQGSRRTTNVTQTSQKQQVKFVGNNSGNEYWGTFACAVLTTADSPWIRFDPRYLKEIVLVLPPSPDLLLSGDVERNPGPLSGFPRQQRVLEYSMDDLESIHLWQLEKVQERLNDCNEYQAYQHYPLVLHRGDHEWDEFQDLYQLEQPPYLREPMTNLAIPREVAEPSFLLVVNRLETSF